MYRDGEVDEIARRKAVSINSAIKSRRNVSQSHARLEITDSVPSKMDPVLGKDKKGFYVVSVNNSPSNDRSRVRILSQSQGGSIGSFASDSVGPESGSLLKRSTECLLRQSRNSMTLTRPGSTLQSRLSRTTIQRSDKILSCRYC